MKRKRHRVIDPRKARAAAGGGLGWYERIPAPEKKKCGGCASGEPCPACKEKLARLSATGGPGGKCEKKEEAK